MNREIISKMIKKPPASPERGYIFVSDNKSICEAIITVGYTALYIAGSGDSFFTADSRCDFVREKVNTGTSLGEYTFVLACFRKKSNDVIGEVLENNQIPFKTGAYVLFKDKEYLAKYDRQDELEEALRAYIQRFEGSRDVRMVDKTKFLRMGNNGVVVGIMDIVIVRYLKDTYHMFVMGRELYIYQSGCYSLDTDGVKIKAVIASLIPDRFVTYRTLSAVYNLLIEQPDIQKNMDELNQYPAWWINFQNGMFDVKEWKIWKHSPEYFSINQIPHKLDPKIRENLDSAGIETNKFLTRSMPDPEDRITLWQYFGYAMTRDTGFQKFLILQGDGGTGKSKVIHLLEEIVGLENCSGVSLQDLNERFYPSMLLGKLVNACADIKSTAMVQVDNIKKATGEDIMICEKKGKDPLPFRSYAKLIFSANKVPLNLDEKSWAYYRRLLILRMNHKPTKEEKDMELSDKLHREIGYSIWMALGALKKLYKDGEFMESAGCRERIEELYRAADTVKAFVDECLERQQGSKVAKKLIYEKYEEYCKNYGRKPHSPMIFYKSLEEKGYIVGRTGKAGRYYKDVTLKDEGFIPVE